MKLIKWMCECGEPLPDYAGYEYVICEKCGAKYRVERESSDVLSPPYHITYVVPTAPANPDVWVFGEPNTAEPYESWRYRRTTCGSTSSLGGLRTTHGG